MVSGQLHALAALIPGKGLLNPLDKRLVGPQTQSGLYGEEKTYCPAGNGTRAVGVAILTELSHLT
jgi:hypothetical protein